MLDSRTSSRHPSTFSSVTSLTSHGIYSKHWGREIPKLCHLRHGFSFNSPSSKERVIEFFFREIKIFQVPIRSEVH
ncbi:hypothetical protein HPP92_017843 [Vanilla planifolia]|uniref:Uncharacterized protein n=1 Tax=Vanilla planifolia TaxID=51239 RepID=A0A835Q9W0_VANPL|nr:hypothetical protein HPP92_018426 [Vanilla planifolia]KAG0468515.1 hypothetical protein HPP92_017843 [Vanilla planifolia]